MSGKLKVLIADDHLVVREGLRLILEADERFEVVGEARDGAEAVARTAALAPDVVLMDLRMPVLDGCEAMERIHQASPAVPVVVLTTFNEDALMRRALQAGARGFLLKDTGRQALVETLCAAARGETLLQPDVLARALAAPPAGGGEGLSERELQVLRAVARGERNKEIAAALGISERTVKAHLTNVFNKLGVDSRAGAVAVAIGQRLIEPSLGVP